MRLAKITLIKGIFIPGLGERTAVDNVEVEGTSIQVGTSPDGARMPVHGLVIVTPTAKVVIPWERIESIVTEWIPLKQEPLPLSDAQLSGLLASAVESRAKLDDPRAATAYAVPQPPPTQKKGGRR